MNSIGNQSIEDGLRGLIVCKKTYNSRISMMELTRENRINCSSNSLVATLCMYLGRTNSGVSLIRSFSKQDDDWF